jgi:hypothetical protein
MESGGGDGGFEGSGGGTTGTGLRRGQQMVIAAGVGHRRILDLEDVRALRAPDLLHGSRSKTRFVVVVAREATAALNDQSVSPVGL